MGPRQPEYSLCPRPSPSEARPPRRSPDRTCHLKKAGRCQPQQTTRKIRRSSNPQSRTKTTPAPSTLNARRYPRTPPPLNRLCHRQNHLLFIGPPNHLHSNRQTLPGLSHRHRHSRKSRQIQPLRIPHRLPIIFLLARTPIPFSVPKCRPRRHRRQKYSHIFHLLHNVPAQPVALPASAQKPVVGQGRPRSGQLNILTQHRTQLLLVSRRTLSNEVRDHRPKKIPPYFNHPFEPG